MTTFKKTRGIISDGTSIKPTKLTVRFTSDSRGESLSISDDKDIMLQVDFAGIEEIIEQARRVEK